MSTTRRVTVPWIIRLAVLLTLALAATVAADAAQAAPSNDNTFTFEVLCEGQPVTITGMMAAHEGSTNGYAGFAAGSNSVGVLMGLSVENLLTGETTVIVDRPITDRQELTTCTYTWPLAPSFLLFTAQVLFTPRG